MIRRRIAEPASSRNWPGAPRRFRAYRVVAAPATISQLQAIFPLTTQYDGSSISTNMNTACRQIAPGYYRPFYFYAYRSAASVNPA